MMTGGSSHGGGDGATSPWKNDELSLIVDEDTATAPTSTTNTNDEDVDPWALLAAAAGDREITNDSSSAGTTAPTTTMTHTEGEVFTLPPYGSSSSSSAAVDPSLSSSSSATTTIFPPFLASIATRLQDVDKQYLNLSTKIQEFDTTYQLTNKLTQYNEDVIKPVTARTIEQTSIAALNVRERACVVKAQLSEHVIRITEDNKQQQQQQQQRSSSSAAMANTESSDIDDRGKQWKEGIINIAIPAKEKVVAGMSWLQQRIQETRDRQYQQQQQQQQQQPQQDYSTPSTTTSTSFTRDAVEERLREREKQRRDEFN